MIFKGRTTVTVNVETLDINPGLKPCDFPPPVEKRTASFLSGATEVEPGLSRMKGKEGEYIALDVNAGGIGKKLVLDTAWGSPPVIDTRAGECPGDTFEHRAEGGGFPLSVSKPMGLTLGSMRNKLTITSPLFVTEDVGGLLGEGVSAKGIIGYTLMAENPVRLDLKGGGLTIYDRDGFTPPEGAKRIRIVVDGGRPVVAGVVDGVSGSFIIDTGFGGFGYVVNKEGFDADGETCAAKSLNVGGIVFEDVELDLVPGDDSLPASTIGGLGLAFLERYEAIFDYRGGVLYLVPKEE